MSSIYTNKKWLPLKWGIYNCEGLLDDYEGFRILVTGDEKGSPIFRIAFDNVESYYSIEESSSFNDERRKSGLTQNGFCFIVENSWFIKEFHNISSGIREGTNLNHYAFYFSNQCIDVLAYQEPIVENLNE